jgi:serine/threonine protein kinase
MKDNLIGRSLGQFEIIEEIGRGGMATVYRARQTSINRTVAIKVLPQTLLHDPSFYERFIREVDLVAHLEHPHILPIYDFGEADGTPYIAMRYLAGGSMAQWIRRGLPPLDKLPKPVSQISSALDYAHQQGVIHRDLKPGNVLLDEIGNAYLSDFGIARVLDSNLTGSAIIGTPAYMSPEQANGLPLDARSDIYSLGIVLYELITGREPFEAETPVALLLKHINEPLPSARVFRHELPVTAEQVIVKATAKHPNERYPSAADLSEAFGQAMRNLAPFVPAAPVDDNDATIVDPGGLHDPRLEERRTPRPATGRTATPRPTASSATKHPAPSPATEVAAEAPLTEVQAPRRSRAPLFAGIAVAIVAVAAVVGVLVMNNQPPPVAPTPTPFANAYTVQRNLYTISVPEDWRFLDSSADGVTEHIWYINSDAFFSISLVDKSTVQPDPNSDFVEIVNNYDQEKIRPQINLRFIDGATAEDGSIRRSYRFDVVEGSDFPAGQTDLFYLDRGKFLGVVQVYSAYSTGDEYVPTFQLILDSLRMAQA